MTFSLGCPSNVSVRAIAYSSWHMRFHASRKYLAKMMMICFVHLPLICILSCCLTLPHAPLTDGMSDPVCVDGRCVRFIGRPQSGRPRNLSWHIRSAEYSSTEVAWRGIWDRDSRHDEVVIGWINNGKTLCMFWLGLTVRYYSISYQRPFRISGVSPTNIVKIFTIFAVFSSLCPSAKNCTLIQRHYSSLFMLRTQ